MISNATIYRTLPMLAVLGLAACGKEPPVEQPAGSTDAPATGAQSAGSGTTSAPDLATLLAGDSRAAEDRARDAGRKPAEVIEFLGIEPGMAVIDVIAAGGWYTEVLALAVGPDGSVAAHNPPALLTMRDGIYEKAISERLADDRLPNVYRLDKDLADLAPEDGPFDAALTALNLHDIYHRNGEEAAISALRAVYGVLKPGGVFGVIDHDGNVGQDNATVHRMLKADAIRILEAAGFVVEGDSGILHVHPDDRTRHVFDEGVRGKTHRFLLRVHKPG